MLSQPTLKHQKLPKELTGTFTMRQMQRKFSNAIISKFNCEMCDSFMPTRLYPFRILQSSFASVSNRLTIVQMLMGMKQLKVLKVSSTSVDVLIFMKLFRTSLRSNSITYNMRTILPIVTDTEHCVNLPIQSQGISNNLKDFVPKYMVNSVFLMDISFKLQLMN